MPAGPDGSSVRANRRVLAARSARALALAGVLLLSVTVTACGGSSASSDAVPKSTPEIVPPANTSAEKSAAHTTSTTTTSTAATGSTGETSGAESTGGEAAKSETGGESAGSGAGGGGSAAGGTAAEKEKPAAEKGGKEGAGARAPPAAPARPSRRNSIGPPDKDRPRLPPLTL